MTSKIQAVSPPGRKHHPAYSQAIVVTGGRTLYIGGQDAVDDDGQLVGGDDLGAQTTQALKNVRGCLQAAGGDLEHLVKFTIFLVAGQDARAGFQAWMQMRGEAAGPPPTVTVVFVAALGRPEWLVEIDGIAVLP